MRYFSNLEFLPDEIELGVSKRRRWWTIAGYFIFCLGIFARQLIPYPRVIVDYTNLRWPVLFASFIIGLALFPPLMRRLNKRRRNPGGEHLVTAFSVGFFVDLATAGAAALAKVTHIMNG